MIPLRTASRPGSILTAIPAVALLLEYQDFFTEAMTGGGADPALLFAESLTRRVIDRLGEASPPLRMQRARYYHGFDTDAWEMEFSDEPADDIRITVRTDEPADGAVSAHLLLVGSREEAIAALATHIQGFALECARGEPLPPCPGHPHPLDPKVHEGIACWVCPLDPAHYVEPILPAE